MNDLQVIRTLAYRVRRECEKLVREQSEMLEDELGYSVSPSRLGGLCGDASFRLVHLARRHGVKDIYASDAYGHVFVSWKDYIIDVTATQFWSQRPRVCIVKRDSLKYVPWYWKEQEPWEHQMSTYLSYTEAA